jgi:hypothetical protein
VRSNLPLARTSLIGRDQQVARLERLLAIDWYLGNYSGDGSSRSRL